MTENHIKATARALRAKVERERHVDWPWRRWKNWTKQEIATLAELAGVCFACEGEGAELRFFEW